MLVTRLSLRDFRSHAAAELRLEPGITVLHGPNGAGKTNLLEGLFVGCTGRSFRTSSDRELVRFGAAVARVELRGEAVDGPHEITIGIQPGEARRIRVDEAIVPRLLDVPTRPLATVFSPDRLELVKGTPALRRAHLDQVVAALWPSRAATARRWRSAMRCWRGSVPGRRPRDRWTPGTPRSPATASRSWPTGARPSTC